MKAALIAGLALAVGLFLAAGCGRVPDAGAGGGPLKVAATTSILGDVVREVGGPDIHLSVLLEPGRDPHSFNPTPADLAALSRARLLFANGLGLEAFLPRLPRGPRVVEVSQDPPRLTKRDVLEGEGAHEGHDHAGGEGTVDPHVWFDPNRVLGWVDNIQTALSEADPAHEAGYVKRADAYRQRLVELDAWIREQVELLPPERRRLVSDHAVLNYFAERYGFTVAGVIIPGFSSAAEPSARDLAALEDTIRRERIPALFLTSTASPALAQRLAEDTGIAVAIFYDGSLSPAGGPASTYLDFMRHNVSVFVGALKEQRAAERP